MSLIISAIAKRLQGAVTASRLVGAITKGLFLKILELTDSFSVSETLSKAFSRPVSDSSVVTDAEVKEVGKNATDASSVSDDDVIEFGKNPSDSFALADGIDTIDVGKVLSDTSVTTEEQQFAITKLLADSAFATDDLDGEASILDDQEMQFIKVRSDSGFASESEVKSVGKNTSDSAISADSGSLISQGYTVDNTYFAEDYVGDSRTFT
jgi:hypothetical protein